MSLQIQQNINLLLLACGSLYVGQLYLSGLELLGIVMFSLALEHSFMYLKQKKITHFSSSAMTTALGVSLMMVAQSWWMVAMLIGGGLFQKHFLTWKGQHFFNPSNFALMLGLLLFYHDAHIVLGQLGDSVWLKIVLFVMSGLILVRASRWVIPFVFTLTYVCFQYIFVVLPDPVLIMDDLWHRFYSVSFLLFIVFMLTDPRTTPKDWKGQMAFSVLLALSASGLDYQFGVRVQHLFMALFIWSVGMPLYESWREKKVCFGILLRTGILLFLALSAIIYIEIQPPYYFEMDS